MPVKQAFQTAAYRVVYTVVYAVSLLPMASLYAIGSLAFFLSYHVIGYRKAVVIQNIARSFPDKRYGEIHAITKKFYTCFAAYFAEIIKGISDPPEALDRKIRKEERRGGQEYDITGRTG